jgi:hypothetical protein
MTLPTDPDQSEVTQAAVMQLSQEGQYKVITRINDVVYWMQRHPRAKTTAVHLDILEPYLGATQDE